MKIINYKQFSKKSLWLGMDKQFLIFYMGVVFSLSGFFIVFEISLLILILLSIISYIWFVIKFAKDPYWFIKRLLRKELHRRYKAYNKYRVILPR